MGYTHYFPMTRNFKESEWTLIQAAAKKLFELRKDILANGHGGVGTKSSATKKDICFNGVGDDAHETFYIPKSIKKEDLFTFTKTNRKLYDECVVAMLTIIEHFAPGALFIESDGHDEPVMWVAGTALAEQVLDGLVASLYPLVNERARIVK